MTPTGGLFPDHPLAFLIVQQLRQIGDRTTKKGDVVKRVMHDCLCHGARLTAVGANHKDAGVVVGHGQTPVILGLGGFRPASALASINTEVASCASSRSNAGFSTCITPPSARQPGAPNWYLRTFRYPSLVKSSANRSLRPQKRPLQYKIRG